MHKTIISIIFIVSFLLLSSCNSTKLIPLNERVGLNDSTLQKLNGIYSNNSVDTFYMTRSTVWEHLLRPINNDTLSRHYHPASSIELKVLESKKIQFSFIENAQVKSIKTFKVKCKNGIALIKRSKNHWLEGIPPLFYRQGHQTLNLALNEQLNLILAYSGSNSGGILIMIFGSPVSGKNVFIRQ